MELPVKFDLSNLSGVSLAQVLFPFLPGGILVLGGGVMRPDMVGRFFAIQYLGYFGKIGIALFVAYTCGLFLAMSIVGVVGGIAGVLASLVGEGLQKKWQPWQSTIWRETAKRFIGAEFTPIVDLPVPPDIMQAQLEIAKMQAAAANPPGPNIPTEIVSVMREQGEKKVADAVWAQWFSALESFFGFPDQPTAHLGTMMSQAAHCSAWAVMILMYFGPYHSWAGWLVCWLIVAGAFIECFLESVNPTMDRWSASRQIGAMLRILTQRAQASSASADETNANAGKRE